MEYRAGITTVKYGFTFNVGNYQSRRIELEAGIGPDETHTEVYYRLQAEVHTLGGDTVTAERARAAVEAIRATRN